MAIDELLEFTIQEIDSSSQYLEKIIQLGDANSATLGFLARGAFRRLADQGCILACISPGVGCVGYLLCNTSRNRVKLTHLCVDEMWRGRGIAKILIKNLKEKTYHLYGILASCRRDYKLERMWSSLGFIAIDERPGRSKDGTILTEWWLNYGHPNLFTMLARQRTESSISVAIDANIFYDLADDERADEDSKESKALIADWLEADIELCLTDEIKNEINRNKDSSKRKKLRGMVNRFTSLPCTQEAFDQACNSLRKFFPENMSDSDASDWLQLAITIGSDIKVSFFVTRDTRLLYEIEEGIYQEFGLLIINPIDFIIRLDELRRETEYQPIRLAGTNIEKRRIRSGEQDAIVNQFLNYALGENKTEFRRNFRQFLAKPEQFECFKVGHRGEKPIAFLVYDREKDCELKIPVFRFTKNKLTPTILRHCIFECILTAAKEKRQFTRITEAYLEKNTIIALQEDNFIETENEWLKMNLAISQNSVDTSSYISELCQSTNKGYDQYSPLVKLLSDFNSINNTRLIADIEKTLYPAKIIDATIPTFIIPIKPWWAQNLFDQELAEATLWGAKEELALKRELVYYRSKQPSGGLEAPGRILWYVSTDPDVKNTSSIVGAIRACSRLDQIVIGKPKELYKRFRRLGIYEFKNVLKTAKGDFQQEIMAIMFSDTEPFSQPIELIEIQQILKRKISFQCPYRITPNAFSIIYNIGTSNLTEK
ncbi:MAG: GNAT family N-acetyltransferase [Symploca sp. SIO2C1]|nr:GNAT family N-acetyltransferase [Symploca sp. SIO2C1]